MGTARLISITPDAEKTIIYIARVSNPNNQNNPEIAKLVQYLIKNKHWSPFETANMCVEIKTSRAISAQIERHRSFSFQEFSQRYAEVIDIEPIEIRKQAEKNRQSSAEEFNPIHPDFDVAASDIVRYITEECQEAYRHLIELGVARECARMILPMASSTTLYMNGTIRSWIHYLDARCDDHTQKEHKEIAEQIRQIFIENLPVISEALGWQITNIS